MVAATPALGFAALVVLLAATSTNAVAAPQIALPPAVTNIFGGGGSSSSASTTASSTVGTPVATTTSSGTTASPTSTGTTTSQTKDACPNGICSPDWAGGATCIMMEKSNICPGFKGLWLPTNLRTYFGSEFPDKKSDNIPILLNSTMLDQTYRGQNFSYPTKYEVPYMIKKNGCSFPNQLFYMTSYCVSVWSYYNDRADPCAAKSPVKLNICQSTLDARSASLISDAGNSTACAVGSDARTTANNYGLSVKTSKFASTTSSCISGEANEIPALGESNCGYLDEVTACDRKCEKITASRCAMFRAQASQAAALASSSPASSCDPNDVNACSTGLSVGAIIGIAIGVLVVGGIAALFFVRRRADSKGDDGKKLIPGAPTIARPASMVSSSPNPQQQQFTAPANAPPVPAVSLAPPQPAMMSPIYSPVPTQDQQFQQQQQQQQQFQQQQPQMMMPQATSSPVQPQLPPQQPMYAPTPTAVSPAALGTGAGAAVDAAAVLAAMSAGQEVPIRAAFAGNAAAEEVNLNPGDIVTVSTQYEDGWVMGVKVTAQPGERRDGYFPLWAITGQVPREDPQRFQSLPRQQ
ncbi:hypothetical protein BC828DRAFT_378375 [Blastocladiella britannica]|nr:hypothetical protein BC828DRAFT_378375 [Blastocladiella britannica]